MGDWQLAAMERLWEAKSYEAARPIIDEVFEGNGFRYGPDVDGIAGVLCRMVTIATLMAEITIYKHKEPMNIARRDQVMCLARLAEIGRAIAEGMGGREKEKEFFRGMDELLGWIVGQDVVELSLGRFAVPMEAAIQAEMNSILDGGDREMRGALEERMKADLVQRLVHPYEGNAQDWMRRIAEVVGKR